MENWGGRIICPVDFLIGIYRQYMRPGVGIRRIFPKHFPSEAEFTMVVFLMEIKTKLTEEGI